MDRWYLKLLLGINSIQFFRIDIQNPRLLILNAKYIKSLLILHYRIHIMEPNLQFLKGKHSLQELHIHNHLDPHHIDCSQWYSNGVSKLCYSNDIKEHFLFHQKVLIITILRILNIHNLISHHKKSYNH